MMLRLLSLALCASLVFESGSCFTSAPSVSLGVTKAPSSALSMSKADNDERKFAASVLTAAFLFANVVSMAPAFAAPGDFAGSSQVVAAKSGGRMGGRSSMGSRGPSSSSYSRPSSSSYSRSSSVSHTTVIHQPVYVAPPVYGGGYGYGMDAGSVGLTVGLSAINGISREMREQGQEREIAKERAELSEARMRQAELEGRLRALEAGPR